MPQRQNLKPALADTLRSLRNDVQSGATVPHGVKTVQPGEGLQLVPPGDGSEIFWDWETANTWDTRITEGRSAIAQAERDIAQARLDLDAGAARVDENRAILDALAPRVDAAESTVAEATKNLGVLEGTVGDVSAAAKAAAKDAKDALYVGLGGNLIPNGDGRAPQGWETFEWRTTGDTNGNPGVFGLKGTVYRAAAAAAAAAAGDYQFSISVMGEHDGGIAYVQLVFYGQDKTQLASPYPVSRQPVPNGTWRTFTAPVTAPPGTATVQVRIYPNHQAGVQANDYVWVTGVSLRPVVPGALIVNGSITGKQISGESVAAEVVRSMTAEHRNLVVTESAILQHTTLLGTTLADELNVRRLLRGRDAILDGTVDINQLNVTGPMAAEIVRMMDAETRRLVVTDDAILNRATIVQSLVTPELISQKADIGFLASKIISSGLFQTSTAANRGVKIDGAGVRAWDDTGQQTVQINGRSNYLVGEFATAPDKQRVRLRSTGSIAAADFFGSNNTTDHLAIWHQADAGQNTVSKIIAHHDVAQVKGNPGMLLYPFRGEFAFTGRWAQESDTLKFLRIDNSGGLGPGGYVDLTYTYVFPFTSEYTVLMPYLSVETASGRECIAMIMRLTYSTVKLRVVNKSAGDTGAIKVRGIVFNMNDRAYNQYW